MLGSLFKPKWQHKDARTRLLAIPDLGGSSPELIQMAQSDENTGVRLEAIAYLASVPVLVQLGKGVGPISDRARQRLQALVADSKQYDAEVVEVFTWLQGNPGLLHALARDPARLPALRKLALTAVTDEKVLYLIADQEASRDLQYQAASQINSLELLLQLVKAHGKKNKRLPQLLKERMTTEQATQQRVVALEKLCADLEALGRNGQWAQDKTRLLVLQQSWKQQGEAGALPADLEQRFRAAEKEFQGRLERYEAEQAAIMPLRASFAACLQEAAELQQTLREHPEQLTLDAIDQQLVALQERWVGATRLPDVEQASLDQRWVAQFVSLTDARDAISTDLKGLEDLQACCRRAESLRNSDKPLQSKRLTDLQSDWTKIKRPRLPEAVAALEQRFHQAMNSLGVKLEKQAAQRGQILQAMRSDLLQMETDLEAEKYGEAIDLHRKLTQALHDHTDLPAAEVADIKHRLHVAAPLVIEFKDWRRWGTDQAREHLIETAERLERDESMDPQVRAKEIKALREEWRKLAQMEPGQQRKQWKTFDSKVTAAYEVSKQHFAEQASEREASLRQREQVCAALEAMQAGTDWDNADWHAQYAAMNQLRKQWKECGTVGHKEWKAVNERFNAAMDALEAHFAAERAQNFAAREGLVAEAVALLEQEDVPAAIEQAKALQAEWRITVSSRPKDEQRLWKQFRAPIDELFDRLKDVRKAQRSETEQRIDQKTTLCVQLESWQGLSGDEFMQASKGLDGVRQAFAAIRDIPKPVWQKLDERFQRAEQAVQDKKSQVRWQLKLAGLDTQAAESVVRKQASAGLDSNALAQQQAEGELLCMQLEILLDIPTPAAFRQARMQYQVAKMSESMRSRSATTDAKADAFGLLQAWYKLGAMPAAALDAQDARIAAVRAVLGGA